MPPDISGSLNVRPILRACSLFQILALVFLSAAPLSVLFLAPQEALAITCGTGSNITFSDIGGGQCRGFITATINRAFIVVLPLTLLLRMIGH